MPLVENCKEPGCDQFAAEGGRGRCEKHRTERNKETHQNRRFYKSGGWKGARLRVLRRDGYVCRNPDQNPNCRGMASQVDHIVPLNEWVESYGGDPLDEDNLQALCAPCHSKKTYREVVGRGDWRPGGD